MRLKDLMSGVVEVMNEDGFPLESNPPQGRVMVRMGTGHIHWLNSNVDEFEKAQSKLKASRHCMQCGDAYVESDNPWPMQPYCPICTKGMTSNV